MSTPTGEWPEQSRILVCVLSYSGMAHADITAWCSSLSVQMQDHPHLGELRQGCTTGYPTDRVRNAIAYYAREQGFHYVVMVDDDMRPDLYPNAAKFLPSALTFAHNFGQPCVIAAPYCGAPPEQRCLVMQYGQRVADAPPDIGGMALESIPRESAATRTGFEQVAALPTGLMMFDVRVLDILPPPWFAYEYQDPPYNTKLASTEDIVFSRNLSWLGVPQFAAWDSWAGHWKKYLVGKPRTCAVDDLPLSIWKAVERGYKPPLAKEFEATLKVA